LACCIHVWLHKIERVQPRQWFAAAVNSLDIPQRIPISNLVFWQPLLQDEFASPNPAMPRQWTVATAEPVAAALQKNGTPPDKVLGIQDVPPIEASKWPLS